MPVSETNQSANRPLGRNLSDLWLDNGEGIADPYNPPRYDGNCRLHPAEWRLLEEAASGFSLHLADEPPHAPNKENRIRAELLRFIALGGDAIHPLHEFGIYIKCGYVEGFLEFVGTELPHNFVLRNCHINDDIIFQDCSAKTLMFTGSRILSLNADRLKTTGGVFLNDGFSARGTVRLAGARIGDDLTCRDGKFLCSERSLIAEGASIAGALIIDHGFLASGTLDLTNTTIGTSLYCTGGTFSAKGVAINASNIKVGNSVYLNSECRIRGEISFQSAEIGDDLTFQGGAFETKGEINLRNAKIGNMLTWRGVAHMRGELNLAGASCKSLNMDEAAWFLPSQIRLDNFSYQRFVELPEGCGPIFWKNWLERQPKNHLNSQFRPNPYQHLSRVLESMGHEEEAREVRIERRERQRLFSYNHVPMPKPVRHLTNFWRRVQKIVVGHGYRPGYAVVWLLAMMVVGSFIYEYAARTGIMTPTHPLIFKQAIWEGDLETTKIKAIPKGEIPADCRKNWVYPKGEKLAAACKATVPSEYSSFNAIIYSMDTAIPVVNFRMEADWSPRVVDWKSGDTDWAGWFVRLWEWVQIGLGWVFSLLFVSAIGGVIKRD